MTVDWKKVIKLEKIDGGYKGTFTDNGIWVGDFLVKEDGYYDWWPVDGRAGYIPAVMLHALANCLDELNKEWDEKIQNDPTIPNSCK